jgi:predicted DNA-binding transcriptional regulator AlpA
MHRRQISCYLLARKDGRRLLKRKEVLRIFGVSNSTLWEWMRAGLVPKSRVINGRTYWFSDEIDACLDNLPTSKLKGE